MTPDPITTAREALKDINLCLARSDLPFPIDEYNTITAALSYAEKLKAENERLKYSEQYTAGDCDEKQTQIDGLYDQLEKLKAERDEADRKFNVMFDQEKVMARRAQERFEEITRLTSQLDQVQRAETQMAFKVTAQQYQIDLYKGALEEIRSSTADGYAHRIATNALKDRQAKGKG